MAWSLSATYGVRGDSLGWSRFQASAAAPSRASSFHEVTDQVSAETPHSSRRICWASWTHGKPTPEPSSWTREQRRVAVGVLETLTGERRTTSGGADQEAA